MSDAGSNHPNRRPGSGPFGMGWEGHVVIAIIIVASAVFAASRGSDWVAVLISGVVPPLVMFALIYAVSHVASGGQRGRGSSLGSWGNDADQQSEFGQPLFGYHRDPQTPQGRAIAVQFASTLEMTAGRHTCAR